ncbi:unnamed protein product [Larinioides sclopetarius]|uniref:Uncharacterized protein n=1 Tax=Larinioides sclopetarius TaxID=280406 RepID=A0AAV1ZEU0_9ARAC
MTDKQMGGGWCKAKKKSQNVGRNLIKISLLGSRGLLKSLFPLLTQASSSTLLTRPKREDDILSVVLYGGGTTVTH